MDWCRRKKPLSFFFLFSTQSSSTYPLIHHWSLKGDQKNLSYMCFDSFKAHSLLTLYSYSCLLSGMSTAWGPITIGPKRDDANNSTINSLSEKEEKSAEEVVVVVWGKRLDFDMHLDRHRPDLGAGRLACAAWRHRCGTGGWRWSHGHLPAVCDDGSTWPGCRREEPSRARPATWWNDGRYRASCRWTTYGRERCPGTPFFLFAARKEKEKSLKFVWNCW